MSGRTCLTARTANLGLRKVVSPSGLGVGNGLADDVLKVAVHDQAKGVM